MYCTVVPRARVEEDQSVAGLLLRTYSAGPVSPICFHVSGRKLLRAATLDDSINPNSGYVRNTSVAVCNLYCVCVIIVR